MDNTIRVLCVNYYDEWRMLKWPTLLCCRPIVGDLAMQDSSNRVVAKISSIRHVQERQLGTCGEAQPKFNLRITIIKRRNSQVKKAFITVGMQYGDEGKGSTVETLCHHKDADLVVALIGAGPQCGHNITTSDGRHHTFSQWGCGTFQEIPTFLGKNVIINPFNMLNEAKHLYQMGIKNAYSLISVDPDCLVATDYHILANRIRESCRDNKHGSVVVKELVRLVRMLLNIQKMQYIFEDIYQL